MIINFHLTTNPKYLTTNLTNALCLISADHSTRVKGKLLPEILKILSTQIRLKYGTEYRQISTGYRQISKDKVHVIFPLIFHTIPEFFQGIPGYSYNDPGFIPFEQ